MGSFYEQFQTKDYKTIEKVFKYVTAVLVIAIFIFLLTLNFIIVIPFEILYLVITLLSYKVIVEYEYKLIDDEISIYKIMKKSKRKEIAKFNIREINSIKQVDKVGKDIKVIKAFLNNSSNKPMVYLVNSSNGIIGYELSADEKLISLIKKVNPLAFY